jgi:hypothetical protein
MPGGDDEIQPVPKPEGSTSTGNSTSVDGELILATVSTFNIDQNLILPVHLQYPPVFLGFIPAAHGKPLIVDGIENVRLCTITNVISSDDLVNGPGDNPLLAIWSAKLQVIGAFKYLVLPPTGPNSEESRWLEDHHPGYPSNKLLVRKSYEKAFSIFLAENLKLHRRASHLALGGTSGLGKTFFYRYIIWRLLHPDGIEVVKVPETIFLWTNPKEWKGYLYHEGSFYSITSIGSFLSTTLAQNMFNRRDAWMICDGAPPTTYMQCPILVSSSPGNFQANDVTDAKKFFKTANCKVYLPPWRAEEVWETAKTIYELTDVDEAQLMEKFTMYGGIARSLFLNFRTPNQPLRNLFVVTDVTTAINEVGSTDLNHQKVSGMILHLIPDNTLRQISYQWGSTAIMETAFETMFKVSKSKIVTFLHAGIGLHLGTFYGLLFEPYFHARVTQQGYSGRIRKLMTPASRGTSVPLSMENSAAPEHPKRNWYGAKKLETEVYTHSIPVQRLHHFHLHTDIQSDKYNVPDRKNFAAVDAIAPALGEMYQITSADSHSIKGIHLRPLRKVFEKYLATGERVKLIFVVPPNRFENYKAQKYIFPGTKDKGTEAEVDDYERAPWDEDEPPRDSSGHMSKAALLQEVNSWVDQYVMEVNVDPLLKTVDKRVESQVKKSFLQQWSPFTSADAKNPD